MARYSSVSATLSRDWGGGPSFVARLLGLGPRFKSAAARHALSRSQKAARREASKTYFPHKFTSPKHPSTSPKHAILRKEGVKFSKTPAGKITGAGAGLGATAFLVKDYQVSPAIKSRTSVTKKYSRAPVNQRSISTGPKTISQRQKQIAIAKHLRPHTNIPKVKLPVSTTTKTNYNVVPKRTVKKSPNKVASRPVNVTPKMAAGRKAGKLEAAVIRKFGVTSAQIRQRDIKQKQRLMAERGGKIPGPKLTTAKFISPFAGDIAKVSKSGYHIFRGKGAADFRKEYAAAKGKKFKWRGTGKWYK